MLLKSGMKYKHPHIKCYSSFERTMGKLLRNRGKAALLVCIYRMLFIPVTTFLEEIVKLFEVLASFSEDVLFAGDVNIHMDEDGLYPNRVSNILDSFNFTQQINFPTHKLGHALDIVATPWKVVFMSQILSQINMMLVIIL